MQQLYDEDRERILLLVLREAAGEDVAEELNRYPAEARGKFRTIVCEAQMVRTAKVVRGDGGEALFSGQTALTPRGRRRLDELRAREASGATASDIDPADDDDDDDE
jgi:hypothetical protein